MSSNNHLSFLEVNGNYTEIFFILESSKLSISLCFSINKSHAYLGKAKDFMSFDSWMMSGKKKQTETTH